MSVESHDVALPLTSTMEQAISSFQMEGEVKFRSCPESNLMKAVDGTEWMYRRGALGRGKRVRGYMHVCVVLCVYAYTSVCY